MLVQNQERNLVQWIHLMGQEKKKKILCFKLQPINIVCVSIPENGTPLQYCCLENPMGGGGSWAAVHGVSKSRKRLSDFLFTFHFPALENEMATHSSVLAWRIPGTGEPGGLPSMGSHRVGHDWSDLAAAAVLVYIYTMEYYSAIKKSTFESVLMRWMKLEPIIQSEVSQKTKKITNAVY